MSCDGLPPADAASSEGSPQFDSILQLLLQQLLGLLRKLRQEHSVRVSSGSPPRHYGIDTPCGLATIADRVDVRVNVCEETQRWYEKVSRKTPTELQNFEMSFDKPDFLFGSVALDSNITTCLSGPFKLSNVSFSSVPSLDFHINKVVPGKQQINLYQYRIKENVFLWFVLNVCAFNIFLVNQEKKNVVI